MVKLPKWLSGKSDAWAAVAPERVRPLSDSAPCGLPLEFDNDFAVLQTRLRPRGDVQYGDFVQASAGPDWGLIERDALALLERSRDLQVLVWFTRARCALSGAAGLLEGLQWMHALLQKWPDDVHTQLVLDGERDVAVRANTIAAITDPEGLMGQVRQIQISGGSGTRLSVRDVERAFAKGRASDALAPEAVRQQLRELRSRGSESLAQLETCWRVAEAIQDLCKSQMAADAPSLAPLVNLLAQVLPSDAEPTPAPAPAQAAPRPNPEDTPMPKKEKGPAQLPPAPPPEDLGELSQAEQRAQMLQAIHTVRRWLEENEPSSPVAILLKQAERLWGRRFAEVAQAIPIELLTQWDQQE